VAPKAGFPSTIIADSAGTGQAAVHSLPILLLARNYAIIRRPRVIAKLVSDSVVTDAGCLSLNRFRDSFYLIRFLLNVLFLEVPFVMSKRLLYRIVFMNQGKIYEIYARSISHGELFGFIEVEDIVFGERSSVVVDPTEERIKSEFSGVQRTYIPLHSVVRIDQVEKQGVSKISDVTGDNVSQFPLPMYTPGGAGGDKSQ
jgi:hypothetical protein